VRTSDPPNALVCEPQYQPNGQIVIASRRQVSNRNLLSPTLHSLEKITIAQADALRHATPGVLHDGQGAMANISTVP
jgi:hypothetical protein